MKRLINIIIAFIFMFGLMGVALHVQGESNKPECTAPVLFFNYDKGTLLGLAKYVVDDNGEPIDYIILNKRWGNRMKLLKLEKGYYAVTQYVPKHGGIIIDFKEFKITDCKKSVRIEFGSIRNDNRT